MNPSNDISDDAIARESDQPLRQDSRSAPMDEERRPSGGVPKHVARETLTGDRACTTCFHPLIGRAIEREPTTGLLYVRCGECGTATALAEYPTATPWIRRIKAVVAGGLIATMLAALLLLAAAAGGVVTAASLVSAEESGRAVYERYVAAMPSTGNDNEIGPWASADSAWLGSPAGIAAIGASRFSVQALEPFLVILGLGLVPLVPLSILIGGAAMRRGALVRMAAAAAPVIAGCLVIAVPTHLMQRMPAVGASWSSYAQRANMEFFVIVSCILYVAIAALAALAAPALLALFARAVLPPGDRRLVAWIWEWRGKPVPRED